MNSNNNTIETNLVNSILTEVETLTQCLIKLKIDFSYTRKADYIAFRFYSDDLEDILIYINYDNTINNDYFRFDQVRLLSSTVLELQTKINELNKNKEIF